jgi:hypothetical protein
VLLEKKLLAHPDPSEVEQLLLTRLDQSDSATRNLAHSNMKSSVDQTYERQFRLFRADCPRRQARSTDLSPQR